MWAIKKCVLIKRGGEYLPDLPEEIMMDILQRLPVYSILALRCLSKQWLNLIGDPKFYNIYRTNSFGLFIFNSKLCYALFKHPNKCRNGMLPDYTLHYLPFHYEDRKGFAPELLMGWFNGLSCVLTESKSSDGAYIRHFNFHNLLTRTSFVVDGAPPPPWAHYGVGYDCRADDHKIWVVPLTNNSQFWVYSCKNLCWNMFDGFPSDEYSYYKHNRYYRGGYSFNGIIHSVGIIAGQRDDRPVSIIITYDLHSRRFGQIAVPCGWISPSRCKVTEFKGQLCFMAREAKILYVWVMKESSWTKLFSCESGSILIPYIVHTKLYESEDGIKNMLFPINANLCYYLYNFNYNRMEELEWGGSFTAI